MSTQKQGQITIAVSATAKAFVKEMTETFSAPSKSKDVMAATEKESVDALVKFVKDFRFTTEERFKLAPNEAGELVETNELEEYEHDHLADIIGEVMAERMNITRNVSPAREKELQAARDKQAELEARIAELTARLEAKHAPQLSANEY